MNEKEIEKGIYHKINHDVPWDKIARWAIQECDDNKTKAKELITKVQKIWFEENFGE